MIAKFVQGRYDASRSVDIIHTPRCTYIDTLFTHIKPEQTLLAIYYNSGYDVGPGDLIMRTNRSENPLNVAK